MLNKRNYMNQCEYVMYEILLGFILVVDNIQYKVYDGVLWSENNVMNFEVVYSYKGLVNFRLVICYFIVYK